MLSAWDELAQRWHASLETLSALSLQEEWWQNFMLDVRQHKKT